MLDETILIAKFYYKAFVRHNNKVLPRPTNYFKNSFT